MEVFEHMTRASQHHERNVALAQRARATRNISPPTRSIPGSARDQRPWLDLYDRRACSAGPPILAMDLRAPAHWRWNRSPAIPMTISFIRIRCWRWCSSCKAIIAAALARVRRRRGSAALAPTRARCWRWCSTYSGDHARATEMARAAMRRGRMTYPPWYEWILGPRRALERGNQPGAVVHAARGACAMPEC